MTVQRNTLRLIARSLFTIGISGALLLVVGRHVDSASLRWFGGSAMLIGALGMTAMVFLITLGYVKPIKAPK